MAQGGSLFGAEVGPFYMPISNQPNVATDSNGPEIRIASAIELVELHPRIRRIELQIEGGRLDNLLFIAGQLSEAVGECVGDSEFHVL